MNSVPSNEALRRCLKRIFFFTSLFVFFNFAAYADQTSENKDQILEDFQPWLGHFFSDGSLLLTGSISQNQTKIPYALIIDKQTKKIKKLDSCRAPKKILAIGSHLALLCEDSSYLWIYEHSGAPAKKQLLGKTGGWVDIDRSSDNKKLIIANDYTDEISEWLIHWDSGEPKFNKISTISISKPKLVRYAPRISIAEILVFSPILGGIAAINPKDSVPHTRMIFPHKGNIYDLLWTKKNRLYWVGTENRASESLGNYGRSHAIILEKFSSAIGYFSLSSVNKDKTLQPVRLSQEYRCDFKDGCGSFDFRRVAENQRTLQILASGSSELLRFDAEKLTLISSQKFSSWLADFIPASRNATLVLLPLRQEIRRDDGNLHASFPFSSQSESNFSKGERVFYSSLLTTRRTCWSCHSDRDFNSVLMQDLSSGRLRKLPSLHGAWSSAPFGISGDYPTIRDYILATFKIEGGAVRRDILEDAASSLDSYLSHIHHSYWHPRFSDLPNPPTTKEIRGLEIFSKKCASCHQITSGNNVGEPWLAIANGSAPLTSTKLVKDFLGNYPRLEKINPPSLHRLYKRSALFGGGQARSIAIALRSFTRIAEEHEFPHFFQNSSPLTDLAAEDRQALEEFLRTL